MASHSGALLVDVASALADVSISAALVACRATNASESSCSRSASLAACTTTKEARLGGGRDIFFLGGLEGSPPGERPLMLSSEPANLPSHAALSPLTIDRVLSRPPFGTTVGRCSHR
jgi:hypothetical protein